MKGFFSPLSLHEGEKNVSGIKVGFVLVCLFPFLSLSDMPAYKSFCDPKSNVKQCVL